MMKQEIEMKILDIGQAAIDTLKYAFEKEAELDVQADIDFAIMSLGSVLHYFQSTRLHKPRVIDCPDCGHRHSPEYHHDIQDDTEVKKC